MPATEQTWYDQKLLHIIFAVSSVVLLISTVWMFAVDHARAWKPYQKAIRRIDLRYNDWRELQFRTEDAELELQRLQAALKAIQGRGVDRELLAEFQRELAAQVGNPEAEFPQLERLAEQIKTAAEGPAEAAEGEIGAVQARRRYQQNQLAVAELETKIDAAEGGGESTDALGAELEQVRQQGEQLLQQAVAKEEQVARLQQRLFDKLDDYLRRARIAEDAALVKRKFKSADLDAAKGTLGLKVRDERPQPELDQQQEEIELLKNELQALNLAYQKLSAHRVALQKIRNKMKESEAELKKKIEDQQSDLKRLATARVERRSNYFERWGVLPVPGKKWLELPILDAFNSPLKIDNLWHEGLEWDVNFRKVRRFDRCTTCHQSMQKTMPGSAVDGAFEREQFVQLDLSAAVEEGASADPLADANNDIEEALRAFYGLRFAAEGLLSPSDFVVSFVQPYSRGAKAKLTIDSDVKLEGAQLRELPLQPDGKIAATKDEAPGLQVGDVITHINGDPIDDRGRAMFRLIDAAGGEQPIHLSVRRGLPNPYTSHPRLDLFVGSLSPHTQAKFACTVCHEGQGSATDFKWSSHTPNSPRQREDWVEKLGWFDNHHWIYPMYPKRFAESACLKCHHNVTELEPSEKFPDPPAPKLTHGHQLVAKYGCFGCHEVNGYDGADRVGPDLRSEPNFFAVAQQLQVDPGFAKLTEDEQQLVGQLVEHPGRTPVRRQLLQLLKLDADSPEPRLSVDAHQRLAPLLKDVEHPGELRRAGPSLRFVGSKLDGQFLYDWIRQPAHFRPSTRMPQFFGMWDHLESDQRPQTKAYEEIEIYSMVRYLELKSQPFEYLSPPEGVSETTPAESIARGKIEFQKRCLACHSHSDFPDVAKYRESNQIQQAPDLSGLAGKFAPARNPNGEKWLYSWVKQPARYHVRTVMPNMFLEPIEQKDALGKVVAVRDPAADIVAFLMSNPTDWRPAEGVISELDANQLATLDELTMQHLTGAFFEAASRQYLTTGIPDRMRGELKGAETELLVPDDSQGPVALEQKLAYLGRKTVAKYGCYGCHDIPGFEDAKPIGTGLADWGRKETSKLAFEHIHNYLHAGHGGAAHDEGAEDGDAEDGDAEDGADAASEAEAAAQHGAAHDRHLPPFYEEQLNAGNRIGFLFQKLLEPRSYDYKKTRNKQYNERLRMPKFPFDNEDREAVSTFVLGLVADPPTATYIFQPDERRKAILEGQQVLQKYNCGGCHVLEAERLGIAFAPETYGPQQTKPTFPFVVEQFLPEQIKDSATPDRRNQLHATVRGMPTLSDDGKTRIYDEFGDEAFDDESYSPLNVEYSYDLWKPALIGGNPYQVGELPLTAPSRNIEQRYAAHGGDLTKYLLPHVVAWEKQVNPNAKGGEAWAWLPPPLVGQGAKVQTDWLHSFLLNPYPIRPAVVLRMPKFNMSPEEATKLVNYFAAKDGVEYPYSFRGRQQSQHLEQAAGEYQQRLTELAAGGTRFGDAMKIVTSQNYCVKCHIVADFEPTSSDRAKAPDLSEVYRRLRPEYVRQWIAKPTSILPYTAMPVNITYNAELPLLGTTVPQDLYHGDSVEQLDAVVDVLMNFDDYAKSRSSISTLVKENAPPPTVPVGADAATGSD